MGSPDLTEVEHTYEFGAWWQALSEAEQNEHQEEVTSEVGDQTATVQNEAIPTWRSPSRSYAKR